MERPSLSDTIVAVSSGWTASPVGIVRLSGATSISLAAALGVAEPSSESRHVEARLALDDDLTLPATAFIFRAPHSYTGQDVVELHTVGNLPLLRALCARLIALGARRALPGEFTARAVLGGKLSPEQVAGVLALMHAGDQSGARAASRAAGVRQAQRVAALVDELTDLLARVEAGIDFVDEEDVRFITRDELDERLTALLSEANALAGIAGCDALSRPHVALAGLPNAGKSTLFNALIGRQRAIVSPIVGTTRDVLSAEVRLGDCDVVLQDCAGLGDATDDLALAAHVAAERATENADLVLWIHDATVGWTNAEREIVERIDRERVLIVGSKAEFASHSGRGTPIAVCVSAVTGEGLRELRSRVAERLSNRTPEPPWPSHLSACIAALHRSIAALAQVDRAPELMAIELRLACAELRKSCDPETADALLERIFAQFCVGK
ncbi:MAG: GTPase [Phycisphaerae bacterium]